MYPLCFQRYVVWIKQKQQNRIARAKQKSMSLFFQLICCKLPVLNSSHASSKRVPADIRGTGIFILAPNFRRCSRCSTPQEWIPSCQPLPSSQCSDITRPTKDYLIYHFLILHISCASQVTTLPVSSNHPRSPIDQS